jgi:hypothetical protein
MRACFLVHTWHFLAASSHGGRTRQLSDAYLFGGGGIELIELGPRTCPSSRNAPSPFGFSYFVDRVKCFCPGQPDHNPIYASSRIVWDDRCMPPHPAIG